MGWQGLDARWVKAGLDPALGVAFRAWIAARDALSDERRRGYLLNTRMRYLKSRPAPLA